MSGSKTRYILKMSTAKMPVSCWGKYQRIAVLEVDEGVDEVAMISERAKGVVRVVETWERLNVGKHYPHGLCAASLAARDAQELVDRLNLNPHTTKDENDG